MRGHAIYGYTIYHDPRDFPGKYVVRGWSILEGKADPVPDSIAHAIADDLAGTRAALPAGLVCLPRHPIDDPAIVEVWI